jgi:hypothetical protein
MIRLERKTEKRMWRFKSTQPLFLKYSLLPDPSAYRRFSNDERISLYTLGFLAQLRLAQSQTLHLITRETVVKPAVN